MRENSNKLFPIGKGVVGMFMDYQNLSEFQKRRAQAVRKEMDYMSDTQFEVWMTLANCVTTVTGKLVFLSDFFSKTKDISNGDLEIFKKIYYSTCKNCLIFLSENDKRAEAAFEDFETLHDVWAYLSERNTRKDYSVSCAMK